MSQANDVDKSKKHRNTIEIAVIWNQSMVGAWLPKQHQQELGVRRIVESVDGVRAFAHTASSTRASYIPDSAAP